MYSNCFSVSGDIWRSTKGHRGNSGRVKIHENLVSIVMYDDGGKVEGDDIS